MVVLALVVLATPVPLVRPALCTAGVVVVVAAIVPMIYLETNQQPVGQVLL
jgi:hypothetical protein